jgi:hypothetical protein
MKHLLTIAITAVCGLASPSCEAVHEVLTLPGEQGPAVSNTYQFTSYAPDPYGRRLSRYRNNYGTTTAGITGTPDITDITDIGPTTIMVGIIVEYGITEPTTDLIRTVGTTTDTTLVRDSPLGAVVRECISGSSRIAAVKCVVHRGLAR